MIVPDTSAWVEYLRRTGRPIHLTVRQLIHEKAEIAVTEVVVMEVLAGARDQRDLELLRSTLLSLPMLPLEGLGDFEEAAVIYRACRAGGETIRSLMDCLVAVPVIRAGAEILHNDADFDVISRHSDLQIHPL